MKGEMRGHAQFNQKNQNHHQGSGMHGMNNQNHGAEKTNKETTHN